MQPRPARKWSRRLVPGQPLATEVGQSAFGLHITTGHALDVGRKIVHEVVLLDIRRPVDQSIEPGIGYPRIVHVQQGAQLVDDGRDRTPCDVVLPLCRRAAQRDFGQIESLDRRAGFVIPFGVQTHHKPRQAACDHSIVIFLLRFAPQIHQVRPPVTRHAHRDDELAGTLPGQFRRRQQPEVNAGAPLHRAGHQYDFQRRFQFVTDVGQRLLANIRSGRALGERLKTARQRHIQRLIGFFRLLDDHVARDRRGLCRARFIIDNLHVARRTDELVHVLHARVAFIVGRQCRDLKTRFDQAL